MFSSLVFVLNFGDETQVIKTQPRIRNEERERERRRERRRERERERRKCMLMEMKARNVS